MNSAELLRVLTAFRELSDKDLAAIALIVAADQPTNFLAALDSFQKKDEPLRIVLTIHYNYNELNPQKFDLTSADLLELRGAALQGKVHAIKAFRLMTGAGLAEAKYSVEQMVYDGVVLADWCGSRDERVTLKFHAPQVFS